MGSSNWHAYILEVKGHVGELEVFSNSTRLRFDPKGFSTFIQTDKLNYLPRQMVKIRVVSIQPDGKPLPSPVDIAVRVSLKVSKHTHRCTPPSKCIHKITQHQIYRLHQILDLNEDLLTTEGSKCECGEQLEVWWHCPGHELAPLQLIAVVHVGPVD